MHFFVHHHAVCVCVCVCVCAQSDDGSNDGCTQAGSIKGLCAQQCKACMCTMRRDG